MIARSSRPKAGSAQVNALRAATERLLDAYVQERQAVFECVADEDGEVRHATGQWLLSLMDSIIAEARDALVPFNAGPKRGHDVSAMAADRVEAEALAP